MADLSPGAIAEAGMVKAVAGEEAMEAMAAA